MEDSSWIVGTEAAVPMQGLRISLCVQKASIQWFNGFHHGSSSSSEDEA